MLNDHPNEDIHDGGSDKHPDGHVIERADEQLQVRLRVSFIDFVLAIEGFARSYFFGWDTDLRIDFEFFEDASLLTQRLQAIHGLALLE
jgi:hypothetical protein